VSVAGASLYAAPSLGLSLGNTGFFMGAALPLGISCFCVLDGILRLVHGIGNYYDACKGPWSNRHEIDFTKLLEMISSIPQILCGLYSITNMPFAFSAGIFGCAISSLFDLYIASEQLSIMCYMYNVISSREAKEDLRRVTYNFLLQAIKASAWIFLAFTSCQPISFSVLTIAFFLQAGSLFKHYGLFGLFKPVPNNSRAPEAEFILQYDASIPISHLATSSHGIGFVRYLNSVFNARS
jgi:hypothetical protein